MDDEPNLPLQAPKRHLWERIQDLTREGATEEVEGGSFDEDSIGGAETEWDDGDETEVDEMDEEVCDILSPAS